MMYEDFEMDELETPEMTDEVLEDMAAWYEVQKEEWAREIEQMDDNGETW